MEITRIPIQLDASMYSAEWDVPRSSGIHLMQIVERMEEERNEALGIKPRDKWASQSQLETYRFGGFLFEHAMAWHIIEVECQRHPQLIRPGEFFWCAPCDEVLPVLDPKRVRCLDAGHKGIFATPDALRIDTMRLKEWKFTWKSMRRAGADKYIDENGELQDEISRYEHMRDGIWRWPIQTMAYAYLCEVLGADQEVFFVNGDYTNMVPQPMRYEMNFTKRDLSENWSSITNMARKEGWI